MKATEQIRMNIEQIPVGEVFTPAAFLHLGSRSTVDRELFQLTRAGRIMRAARGVYVRPKESKFAGKVPPGVFEVAKAKAGPGGVKIVPHGAEAALLFGLSTQVPVRPVYRTTGSAKQFRFGKQWVTLRPTSPRKLVLGGTKVGLAISALWYLGQKEVTAEAINTVKKQLTAEEFNQLKCSQALMPAWLASAIRTFEQQEINAK